MTSASHIFSWRVLGNLIRLQYPQCHSTNCETVFEETLNHAADICRNTEDPLILAICGLLMYAVLAENSFITLSIAFDSTDPTVWNKNDTKHDNSKFREICDQIDVLSTRYSLVRGQIAVDLMFGRTRKKKCIDEVG